MAAEDVSAGEQATVVNGRDVTETAGNLSF
jgi:hypothetical protein